MIKKFYFSSILLFVSGLLIFLTSCNPASKYIKAEKDETTTFLGSNTGFEKKASGLYYLDETVGTGISPQIHDTAFVWYTGQFLDGTVFGSNTGTAGKLLYFPVNEGLMIAGFDEAVTYMKEGGKAKFLVPSSLGYGSQGYYTIPGYTALLYEVQLVKVSKGPAK